MQAEKRIEAASKIFFASFCGARFLTLRPVRRFMALALTEPPYPFLNELAAPIYPQAEQRSLRAPFHNVPFAPIVLKNPLLRWASA
jgi:hypothetical protein